MDTPRHLGVYQADHGPAVFPRSAQLGLEVASYVRELILSGQVRANEPLAMDRIARELDISATPVREGLFTLRGEGFVRFEPRRGFKVSPLRRRDVEDLYWGQAQIVGELARRAAEGATDAFLTDVRHIQSEIVDALKRGSSKEVEALNHEFHRQVHLASDSPKLEWLLSVMVRYAPRRFYGLISGWEEASTHDHDSIIRALEKRHGEAARAAVIKHFEHGGQLVIANLERRGFWAAESETPTAK